jgi:transposase
LVEALRFRLMIDVVSIGAATSIRWRSASHDTLCWTGRLGQRDRRVHLCIMDDAGEICRELKVSSHPEDLVGVRKDPAWRLARIGLEAGRLSQSLFSGLAEACLPVVCIETRQTKAFLKAQVNKSDRNDARGIAQMMRVNLFRPVHV